MRGARALRRNTSGIMPHGRVCIKRAAVNIPVWKKKERKNIKPTEAVKLEMGRRYCYRYCFRRARSKAGRTKMRAL